MISIPRLSPLSIIRWIRNARPSSGKGPRRVAGVMATKDYSPSCSTFETLRDLCDVTIVLDDNSASLFPNREECTEYIALTNRERWNAPGNLTLLLYRAFVHGCEWVVSLDDDIILSSGFQNRADVDDMIDKMESKRLDLCHFPLRDLWDSGREMRVDGIWSKKTFPVLRRNWFFYEGVSLRDPSLRLHTPAFPIDLRTRGLVDPKHTAYHTGCLTREMREHRVEKYGNEDPDNEFQNDYSYMLDELGIELLPVPADDLEIILRKRPAP